MSLNKGKAKVKAKSKSIAKGAGKNKAAVMNSRNPKKPMAISGDTMSNYAMYKKGGKVKKYETGGMKKYQGINSQVQSITPNYDIHKAKFEKLNAETDSTLKARNTEFMQKLKDGINQRNMLQMTTPKSPERPIRKKGGSVKAKKFAALAPPYDKATAADRIAGAKKNARKK